jgi:hypothetical protein
MGEGHDVVLHARTRERAAALGGLAPGAAGVVIGDLSSAAETREPLRDIDWTGRRWNAAQAYADSKLQVTTGGGRRPHHKPVTRLSRTNSWTGWPRSPVSRSSSF